MFWQGERKQATQNKSLGQFDLAEIPPAPRGMPQIEVSFDIDANGILNVNAKDKATNREQSIVIKASSGLSEDEIEEMVRDAESHSAEDAKFEEMVQLRNQADAMIHSTQKMLSDLEDKVSPDEKSAIESAIADVENAVKSDDKDDIQAKLDALSQASEPLVQRMYQDASAGDGSDGAAGADPGAGPQTGTDDAVDAEFEEVKDDDKK